MIVLDYIKNALYEHDCVIVTGFGGFLIEPTTAEINPITNVFQPPSTSLAFNPSLKKDDGLLKSEISIGEGISLDKAAELIKIYVFELENSLHKYSKVTQDGLGTFDLIETKLIFTPESESNFNIEGFGLSHFSFEPIITNEEDMKQVRPVPPARRVVRREPIKKDIDVTESSNETVKENKSSFAKVFFITLPILVVLGVGGFFGYSFLNKSETTVAEQSTKTIKTDEASLLNTDSSVKEKIESPEISSIDTPVKIEETTPEIVSNIVPSTKFSNSTEQYHVIGGVFSTRENAQKYLNKHINGQILEIGTYFKVSVASYNSLNEAMNDIPKLKSQYGSEIWVTKH